MPTRRGIERITDPAQTWDGTFHASALRAISHGNASPFGGLATLYGGQKTFYPTTIHGLAALLPCPPTMAYQVGVLVLMALPVVTSSALTLVLTRDMPGARWAVVATPLLVSLTYSFTTLGTILSTFPYLAAMACLPALVAVVALPEKTWPTLAGSVFAAAGMVAAHPIGVFSFFLFLVPLLFNGFARMPRRRFFTFLGAASLLLAVGAYFFSPQIATVTNYPRTPLHGFKLISSLVFDWPSFYRIGPAPTIGIVLPALALIGAAYLGWSWMNGSLALTLLALSGCAGSCFAFACTPWYSQVERLQTPLAVIMVALAAVAVAKLANLRGRQVVGVLVILALVPIAFMRAGDRAYFAELTFKPNKIGWGTQASRGELDFFETRIRDIVGRDKLIGTPTSGITLAWTISGVDSVYKQLSSDSPNSQMMYLATHLQDIETDPKVCQLVVKNHVNYYYRDNGRGAAGALFGNKFTPTLRKLKKVPDSALKLLWQDRDSGASLYRITGCNQ